MSTLSARILDVRRNPRSKWPALWAEVADRLVAEHGVPSLGNFRNPVKEIFYILLSAKTADSQYRRTNRADWPRHVPGRSSPWPNGISQLTDDTGKSGIPMFLNNA